MANFDTVTAIVGGTGRGQIQVLTLAAITETLFAVGTDTTGTTNVASVTVPSGNATKLVGSGSPTEFNQNSAISSQSFGRKSSVFTEPPFFSTATFDSGRPFKIRVCGTATVAAVTVTTVTNTININIYAGTAISATMKIATLTAAGTNSSTTASVTGQFDLEAVVQWDSVSQKLSGWYGGNNMNTFKANAALSNAVAITSAATLIFSPSAVFADTSAGSVTISELAIDQI